MSQKSKARQLRQSTLLDTSPGLNRPSTSKAALPMRLKRERNAILFQTRSDNEVDEGLGSIKLEPKRSGSHSDDEITPPLRKKRKAIIILSDDSVERVSTKTRQRRISKARKSEDDDRQQPRRRKLVKKCATTLDSSSDNEDLVQEVEKERILSTRLRKRDKKTAFQRNLEKLKRKKQGKPPESTSPEQSEGSSEVEDSPIKGAKPSSGYDSLFDADSDSSSSSGFIVEDGDAATALLPTQFSMESHQDLDHQFKKIFQFFVHVATHPASERHYFMKEQVQKEEYFSVPLQMVRRKLSGLRDSLVTSSVWRPEYKESLDTYPEIDLIPLDFAIPSCDACHLGGRLSTLTGRLSGFPYDNWGFELKDKRQHSSSSSNNSGGNESDSTHSEDVPFSVEFHLGRFCARRTRVYHEFTHWEYALFKSIRDEVDELHANRQSKGFFRVAYAGGIEPPDDLDDADGICEWLDQRKVIDMQWKKLKDMMEDARTLDLDRKRGGDDDD